MESQIKIGSLLLFFIFFLSCNFGDSGYHKEDGKWTWKYYHGGNLEFQYAEIDSINHDEFTVCLLYTSDAADDTPCVDLGGRRIIKKKK